MATAKETPAKKSSATFDDVDGTPSLDWDHVKGAESDARERMTG